MDDKEQQMKPATNFPITLMMYGQDTIDRLMEENKILQNKIRARDEEIEYLEGKLLEYNRIKRTLQDFLN